MSVFQVASWRTAVIGRWAARIAGMLMFLLFLAFFFGEGPPDLSRLTAAERVQAIAMAALFLGLVIAWKWQGLGGSITVAGFALMVGINSSHLGMWALRVPAVIGAVNIAVWARLRLGAPAGLGPWRLPLSLVTAFIGALAVFVLFCANEIFGQPPLMTPTLHPDAGLAGAWHGTPVRVSAEPFTNPIAVAFVIHPDGTVTGAVGDATVATARVTYGRSWFGKLLHMNAPYIMKGRFSSVVRVSDDVWGDQFTVPFEIRGDALNGALFLRGRPIRLTLTRY